MRITGRRRSRQSNHPLRGMLTLGLCSVLTPSLLTVLLIWTPLAEPEQAQSQTPLLMHLDEPQTPVDMDMVANPIPEPALPMFVSDTSGQTTDVQVTHLPQPDSQPQPMTYNGRPLRAVKTIEMTITAYSPDERSCGKWADGITASGYSVWTNAGKLVAADTHILPFGSILTIPGYNGSNPVPVLDRGGKIKGNRLDVLYPTHAIARRWGVKKLAVTVWEYAD